MNCTLAYGEFVCLDLILLVLIVIAMVVAIRAMLEQRRHAQRLEQIEQWMRRQAPGQAWRQARTEGAARAKVDPCQAETPTRAASPTPPPPPRPPAQPAPASAEPQAPDTAPPARSAEERAVQIGVGIAAVALAVAGVLGAIWIYQHYHVSPAVRVMLGSLAGVAMVVAGESLRRRSGWVAAGLVAAGVACLFGCVYFAAHVYVEPEPLISLEVGFALMAAVTAVGVAMALRHGVLVAVVGMLGGFLTPWLMDTGKAQPIELFGYLLLLQIGLTLVTRRRGWAVLAGLTMLGAMAWAGVYTMAIGLGEVEATDGTWVGLFLLGSVGSLVAGTQAGRAEARWGGRNVVRALTWLGAGVGVLLAALLVGAAEFTDPQWVLIGVMSAGLMALGRLDRSYHGLTWLAMALNVATLTVWGHDLPWGTADAVGPARYALTTAGFGAMFSLGGYACLWRSGNAGRWAAVSAAAAVAYVLVAYAADLPAEARFGLPWWAIALIVASVQALMTVPVLRNRKRLGDVAPAVMCIGVTALVSLAMPMAVDRAWLTVAWAMEVPALVLIGQWLNVSILRKLAWALAAGAVVRLLANPFVLEYDISATLIVNELLLAYGAPLAAFSLTAWAAGRESDDGFVKALEVAATALAVAMVTALTMHTFILLEARPGPIETCQLADITDVAPAVVHTGTYGVAWLLVASAAAWTGGRLNRRMLSVCAAVIATGAAAWAIAINSGFALLADTDDIAISRTIFFNELLYALGLPLVLLVGLAWIGGRDERDEARALRHLGWTGALVGLFVMMCLQIRHGFNPTDMKLGDGTNFLEIESYTYSAAWGAYGLAMLAVGIVRRNTALRWASLAVMMLVAGKVFLWDTRQLAGLYRVFSFAGLGVSLMILAYCYHRFVFGFRR